MYRNIKVCEEVLRMIAVSDGRLDLRENCSPLYDKFGREEIVFHTDMLLQDGYIFLWESQDGQTLLMTTRGWDLYALMREETWSSNLNRVSANMKIPSMEIVRDLTYRDVMERMPSPKQMLLALQARRKLD